MAKSKSQSPSEKLLKRRESNRKSAAASRARKKKNFKKLQSELGQLKDENQSLKQKMHEMEKELERLRGEKQGMSIAMNKDNVFDPIDPVDDIHNSNSGGESTSSPRDDSFNNSTGNVDCDFSSFLVEERVPSQAANPEFDQIESPSKRVDVPPLQTPTQPNPVSTETFSPFDQCAFGFDDDISPIDNHNPFNLSFFQKASKTPKAKSVLFVFVFCIVFFVGLGGRKMEHLIYSGASEKTVQSRRVGGRRVLSLDNNQIQTDDMPPSVNPPLDISPEDGASGSLPMSEVVSRVKKMANFLRFRERAQESNTNKDHIAYATFSNESD